MLGGKGQRGGWVERELNRNRAGRLCEARLKGCEGSGELRPFTLSSARQSVVRRKCLIHECGLFLPNYQVGPRLL